MVWKLLAEKMWMEIDTLPGIRTAGGALAYREFDAAARLRDDRTR